MRLLLSAALLLGASAAHASTIYQADFSAVNLIDHTSTGNAVEPSPQAASNFTFGYTGTPSSDSTLNFFGTDGDSLISSDFGTEHFMITSVIDVSALGIVDISITNAFLGVDSFNNSPSEFIEYYYSLDGGLSTTFFSFTDDPNGPDLNALERVDVSSASDLVIGVTANVNGAGDGWDMTELSVSTVPLPAGLPLLLGAGAALGLVRARRRT